MCYTLCQTMRQWDFLKVDIYPVGATSHLVANELHQMFQSLIQPLSSTTGSASLVLIDRVYV